MVDIRSFAHASVVLLVLLCASCRATDSARATVTPQDATPLATDVHPTPRETVHGDEAAIPTKSSGLGSNLVLAMPLVSRDLPAFASHASSPAASAVDADYGTAWRSGHTPTPDAPDWIALDLSRLSPSQRESIYSVWFNEAGYSYDISDGHGYALPGDYEIQSHSAPGGSPPPSSGWTTLVTEKSNTFASGAHVLHLGGANWVRFLCTATAANAAPMNVDTSIQWDLHDAHASVDAWKFIGDSITANAMKHEKSHDSFNELVNRQVPNYPAFEMAGHGYWTTVTALAAIDRYLANFPGKFVGLSLGTNDSDPAAFRANMTELVLRVTKASKVAIVPTIPYSGEPGHVTSIPKLNAEIHGLYAALGAKIIAGPDLYQVLHDGQATMFDKPSDLHPNERGNLAIRQAWADAMAKSLYR